MNFSAIPIPSSLATTEPVFQYMSVVMKFQIVWMEVTKKDAKF